MTRFVLSTTLGSTPQQDEDFARLLKAEYPDAGWWHQLSETWLIVDPSDKMTTSALRDLARRAFPGIHLMVVPAMRGWAGFGNAENMFPWMRQYWNRD